jgi:hypothetical protein
MCKCSLASYDSPTPRPRRHVAPVKPRKAVAAPHRVAVPRTSGSGGKAIDQCGRSIILGHPGQRDPASSNAPHPRVRHPSGPDQKASGQPGSRCLKVASQWLAVDHPMSHRTRPIVRPTRPICFTAGHGTQSSNCSPLSGMRCSIHNIRWLDRSSCRQRCPLL